MRIACPPAGEDRKKRMAALKESALSWAFSDPLIDLAGLYGIEVESGDVRKLRADVSELWDFRKRSGSVERWLIEGDDLAERNRDRIMEDAGGLGLLTVTEDLSAPSYVCPLGGASTANLYRCTGARDIMDQYGWRNTDTVALCGTRPLADIDMPLLDQYAPGAVTEYDAVCGGLERAFGVREYREERKDSDDVNMCSALRAYDKGYRGGGIYSLAAPSSEPEKRRADSMDTFRHFLRTFDVKEGERILLVTSSIYQPFQLVKFAVLAVEEGLEVECTGFDESVMEGMDTGAFRRPENYLQEIKAALDAICRLPGI